MHKSRRQPRVARSTTRAEFLALEDALDAAIYFATCMQPFYKSIGIGCDAANVLSLLLSGAPSSAERALPMQKHFPGSCHSVMHSAARKSFDCSIKRVARVLFMLISIQEQPLALVIQFLFLL
mmetsp:Transcript_266/g.648  ORF Transcript_266/g.648 Transcript_266/m.648 type:complete len:123 (-) Transcript_266:143-511(-)